MGTVAETLGFEPETLWMPELDVLNSERGRLALVESARAELLAASGCNVTVSESDSFACGVRDTTNRVGLAGRAPSTL
jgi:hypothetical protein